jgi:hypothetical protein
LAGDWVAASALLPAGRQPLPVPVPGGSIEALSSFLP